MVPRHERRGGPLSAVWVVDFRRRSLEGERVKIHPRARRTSPSRAGPDSTPKFSTATGCTSTTIGVGLQLEKKNSTDLNLVSDITVASFATIPKMLLKTGKARGAILFLITPSLE